MKKHETILNQEDAIIVVVDYQDKLVNAMEHKGEVTAEILRLLRGAQKIGVPIIGTEQYPKGLGHMVEDISDEFEVDKLVEKTTFSCMREEKFVSLLQKENRKQVVLLGIETHVCILQTALDLLANGYQVFVPSNTTCSRSDSYRLNALERMQAAGVIITNSESVLFELIEDAKNPKFKEVQSLLR